MMEDKIINDVLIYLDGWELQNESHKTRHKPHPPKYLDAFNEDSEDVENTNIRKTVTAKEILTMYDVAKVHVLNYINRSVFPRTPTTHIALCMWTAGLLSQKSRFRKQRVENSYNLIAEAKKLLKPHIKHDVYVSSISGRDYIEDDVENYRFCNDHHPRCKKIRRKHKPHPCNKDHPPHKKHPPMFEYDEPDYDDFFLKNNHQVLKITATNTRGDGTITFKAAVRDKYGNKQDEGVVAFYLEGQETDEFNGMFTRRQYIGEADVSNGGAEYLWIIPEILPVGKRTLYATYQESDDYITAEAYTNILIKKGVKINVSDVSASHGKPDVPLEASITDLNGEPITGGMIQFQVNYTNVGTTVPVIDGTAQYIMEKVPQTFNDNDPINAIYYGTETYAESVANQQGVFTLLIRTRINVENISANPQETIVIEATLTDDDYETPLDGGEYSIYLDDNLIKTEELGTDGKISLEYLITDELSYGEHTLKIVYSGVGIHDDFTQTASLIVRSPIVITMDEIEGNLSETITLTSHVTCDNQPVNTGEITYFMEN